MKALLAAVALTAASASSARAFCGFYVSGAGSEMFNHATQVVMTRVGTRTVLAMQNNYAGPPQDFAMVVPVPVVLQRENVKTLPDAIFGHVDRLAAPRLVEYWEMDPCFVPPPMLPMVMSPGMAPPQASATGSGADLGVRIEAQFVVGEYDIAILSASDSSGLDTWLRRDFGRASRQ